jgi:Flp pilus assembly protein protease CpaA
MEAQKTCARAEAYTALFGGAFALAVLTFRRLPLPAVFQGSPWIARLHLPVEIPVSNKSLRRECAPEQRVAGDLPQPQQNSTGVAVR